MHSRLVCVFFLFIIFSLFFFSSSFLIYFCCSLKLPLSGEHRACCISMLPNNNNTPQAEESFITNSLSQYIIAVVGSCGLTLWLPHLDKPTYLLPAYVAKLLFFLSQPPSSLSSLLFLSFVIVVCIYMCMVILIICLFIWIYIYIGFH